MAKRKDPKVAFADLIRELRTEQNLTQADLAKKAGIQRTYLNDIEVQRRTNLTLTTAAKLADGLGIKLSKLFARAGM